MPQHRPHYDGRKGPAAVRPVQSGQPVRPVRPVRPAQASRGGGGAAMPPDVSQYAGSNPRYHSRGRKQKRTWRVVFWVAIVVLVAALVSLGAIVFSYWKGQDGYDKVADTAFETPLDAHGATLSEMKVDWDALLAVNPDTVGWIYIPGTPVNYPIVQGGDDSTYLNTEFDGSQSFGLGATYGTPFLLASNASDFSDRNNVVQAHNMNNGAMFAAITELADTAAFNQHRSVYVLTPEANYRLESIALVQCAADDPIVRTQFSSDDDFRGYVQDKLDRSVVQPDPAAPKATDVDKLFMFSTCLGAFGEQRNVLFCSVAETAQV